MSILPPIQKKHKICVICEGYEDFYYFHRLIELNVWNPLYNFNLINVKGASNITARFQNEFQNDRYEIILILCDTDKEPYDEYNQIKNKLNKFFGKGKVSDKIIIFSNPCIMQIMLLHFEDIRLQTQSKKVNSAEIERLLGIKNYDAHEEQIKEICKKITRSNYDVMKERVKKIDNPYNVLSSTNISIFLDYFENTDDTWIYKIRKV